jgi:hypothetical protein
VLSKEEFKIIMEERLIQEMKSMEDILDDLKVEFLKADTNGTHMINQA